MENLDTFKEVALAYSLACKELAKITGDADLYRDHFLSQARELLEGSQRAADIKE